MDVMRSMYASLSYYQRTSKQQQILLEKENDAYQLLMFEYMKLPALHLMMSDKEFMPTIERTNERTNNN